MILAADIGGTKTVLGLVEGDEVHSRVAREWTCRNDRHDSFAKLLGEFLGDSPPPLAAACLAVAGPVLENRVVMTNLPWVLDASEIGDLLRIPRVRLLNDIEGAALAMLHLPPEHLREIQAGTGGVRRGHVVVIAPGTGLGEAILCWDGERHHPIESEGGHIDFAPQGPEQTALLEYLRQRFSHVSYERILSGPGILVLYEFLRDTGRADPVPDIEAHDTGDTAALISAAGLDGSQAICVRALDLFVRILGAKAGNLALVALALGGVFLGGGIPPKIVPALVDGRFRETFLDKGRHRHLLERMSVHVALEPRASFLGAARFGLRLAETVTA